MGLSGIAGIQTELLGIKNLIHSDYYVLIIFLIRIFNEVYLFQFTARANRSLFCRLYWSRS